MAYHIELKDLPPRYQEQALKQISKQGKVNDTIKVEQPIKPNQEPKQKMKYHSQSVTTESGVKFRSKAEEKRFYELKAMLDAGEISDLKLEPQFTLVEGYKKPDGTRVKRLHYTADFSYIKDGKLIVEDVKSRVTKTEAYGVRKTLMKDRYGIDIVEIMRR